MSKTHMVPDWMRLTMLVSEVEAHASELFPEGEYRVEISRFCDGEIRVCAVHYDYKQDSGGCRECIYHGTGREQPVYRWEVPPDGPRPEWSMHPMAEGRCWDIVGEEELEARGWSE